LHDGDHDGILSQSEMTDLMDRCAPAPARAPAVPHSARAGAGALLIEVVWGLSLLWLFDGADNEEECLHAISALLKSGAASALTLHGSHGPA
jgi:hypothetical protein